MEDRPLAETTGYSNATESKHKPVTEQVTGEGHLSHDEKRAEGEGQGRSDHPPITGRQSKR